MRSNRHLVVALVIAGLVLFAATALLGSMYHEVRRERTEGHLSRGRSLAASGSYDAAIDEYRAALRLERDNPDAARALAFALLSQERHAEAESYLRDLLRRFPTDGELNRGMARIHAARGREAEARSAYQRAIYGEWPEAAPNGRIETRFELIDYLTRTGAREEVIAELLRLKTELPPGETASLRRVATLLAEQGITDLAIETLMAARAAAPKDAELRAHLADLQLSAGRTSEARASLRSALTLAPGREDLSQRLQVVERVLALDPTLPNLRLVTRTRRARLVLSTAVAQTESCETSGEPEVQTLRKQASARLRQRVRTDAEAAEEDLALSVRLWSAASGCRSEGVEAQALTQVLQRVESGTEQPS